MANSTMVDGLREILESEIYKEAQKIVESEGPLKKREQGDSSRILGRIEGFDARHELLVSLAKYSAPQNLLNDQVVDENDEE